MNLSLPHFLSASLIMHGAAWIVFASSGMVTPPTGQTFIVQLLPAGPEQPERDLSISARSPSIDGRRIRMIRTSTWATQRGTGHDDADVADTEVIALARRDDPRPTSAMESVTQPARPAAEITGRQLTRKITQALRPYFHYPLIARLQGWQGEVRVAVHIARDGRLSNLRLARSSGFPVLDAAALDGLQKIRRLPADPATQLDAHGFDLSVPVVYRLTEG